MQARFMEMCQKNGKLMNDENMARLEQLAKVRAGQKSKSISFSEMEELKQIARARQELKEQKVQKSTKLFKQLGYQKYNDDYEGKRTSMDFLKTEYDQTTENGQARFQEYLTLQKKLAVPFSEF